MLTFHCPRPFLHKMQPSTMGMVHALRELHSFLPSGGTDEYSRGFFLAMDQPHEHIGMDDSDGDMIRRSPDTAWCTRSTPSSTHEPTEILQGTWSFASSSIEASGFSSSLTSPSSMFQRCCRPRAFFFQLCRDEANSAASYFVLI